MSLDLLFQTMLGEVRFVAVRDRVVTIQVYEPFFVLVHNALPSETTIRRTYDEYMTNVMRPIFLMDEDSDLEGSQWQRFLVTTTKLICDLISKYQIIKTKKF